MPKKILFVVAHPDDELLGAGAFIHDAAKADHEIAVAVLNTCDTTRYQDDFTQIVADMERTHKEVGISKLYPFCYTDSNFHNADHRKMVQDIEGVMREFQPDYIFTQHPGDINTDHYWTAASCMEAFRLWQRGREEMKPVKALYLMEVQSSTDWALNPSIKKFNANTYIPVTEAGVAAKIRALGLYENVIRPVPHPRSEEALWALPRLRGAQCGMPYAEAFECVFRLEGIVWGTW